MNEVKESATTLKMSDLCLIVIVIVIAMGVGSRLVLGMPLPLNVPFDYLAASAIAGSCVLCPIVFFKQFMIERRTIELQHGELLWVILVVWLTLIVLCVFLGHVSERFFGLGLFLLSLGLIIHPIVFVSACIYVARRVFVNRTTMLWSDLAGCGICALFCASYFALMLRPLGRFDL